MKQLSIITINYNDCGGLDKTLQSVIPLKKDTNDMIEFIVVDGGSTDKSVEIIKQNQNSIDYWVSEKDKGIYNAMNKGIVKAQGKYIMFVNSGDHLMPSIDLLNILKRADDNDIVYHNQKIVEASHNYIKTYPKQLDFKYFVEDSLPHLGTLIKKELFLKYGLYDESFKIVADWAFYMDCILIHHCSYKYIDDCFASFYLGGISSMPKNFKILMDERNQHISSNYPLYYSLYKEWLEKKDELYRLKNAVSVTYLRKLGFLKWLNN